MSIGEKVSRLILLAQKFAEGTPNFFETKGPGIGDKAANEFMERLNASAKEMFGQDYSQQKICGENRFAPDFYFPDEQTVVEFAFGLDKPMNEYERDIFKCLLAQDRGCQVQKLILVCKPGGQARLSAPGPTSIREWVGRSHNLEIEVWDLVPPE